jgi:hypothetical protein
VHAHDGLRRMLLYTSLRCRDCRHRFWIFNPLKPLLLVSALALLVGLTAWFALDLHGSAATPPSPPATLPQTRAAQGDAEAQLQLAMRYATGDGVPQNDAEAAQWLAKAARQGLAEAQYQYGLVLLQGRGVVQDYKAAFAWIEKPARRGHPHAQFSLGELYRYGTGTPIDKPRAYLWFNLAAAQGVDAAAKARDSLVWQLKPEQLAAMQAEARRMSPGAASPGLPTPAETPTPP